MEEEKKEVVEEAEELKEEEKVEQPAPVEEEQPKKVDDEADVKNALLAFIAAMVGIVLFETGIALIICGIISKSIQKKIQGEVEKKPHKIFLKVAKVAAPIELIVGIVLTALAVLAGIIVLIWWIAVVALAAGAAAEGAASIAVLL